MLVFRKILRTYLMGDPQQEKFYLLASKTYKNMSAVFWST